MREAFENERKKRNERKRNANGRTTPVFQLNRREIVKLNERKPSFRFHVGRTREKSPFHAHYNVELGYLQAMCSCPDVR